MFARGVSLRVCDTCHTPVYPFRRAPVHPLIFPGFTLSGIFHMPQPSTPPHPLCFQALSTSFHLIPPFSTIYAWSHCYYGVLFKPARKASWTGEKAVMGCIRLLFFHVLPPLPCHSACFLPGFFFFKKLYIPYGNSVNAAVAVNYAISFPRICLEPEKGLG